MRVEGIICLGIGYSEEQTNAHVDIQIPIFDPISRNELLDQVIDYLESEEVWHFYEERPLNQEEIKRVSGELRAWKKSMAHGMVGGEGLYAFFQIQYGE